MKRSKTFLAVIAVMVMMVAAFATPAMAANWGNDWGNNWNNHNNNWGNNNWGNNNWGNNKQSCGWYWSFWSGWRQWCWSPWWGWYQTW